MSSAKGLRKIDICAWKIEIPYEITIKSKSEKPTLYSMKLITSLLLIFCVISSIKAQEKPKRFYIGINLGTSLLLNVNDAKGTVGANINIINAGYSFKNKLGVHLKWMGAAHSISKNNEIGYGAILLGPMYSVPLGDKTYLDVKLATGLFWILEKGSYSTSNQNDPTITKFNESEASVSLSNFAAGATFRHLFAKRWSILLITEYNSGKQSGTSYYIDGKQLQAISINAGIAFNI